MIYLDSAATTLIHPEVKKAMLDVLEHDFGNPSSIHELGRKSRTLIEYARKTIAQSINASTSEIFFTSSATESNNTIIRRSVSDLGVTRIITSPIEHACVKNTCNALTAQKNVELVMAPVDKNGKVIVAELEALLSDNIEGKTLVTIMYANNEIGTINDVHEIARICSENEVYFHTDAVQALGKIPLDVQACQFSFLSGTAHKIHGPKGIGFMYIKGGIKIAPLLTGGAQERNMRAGTENIYGIVGLAKACALAVEHMEANHSKLIELRSLMKSELIKRVEDIEFYGPQDTNFLPHILNASFPNNPKNSLLLFQLDIKNVCASAGSACSSGSDKGSHVIRALYPDSDRIAIRFSFSIFNTKEEILEACRIIEELQKEACLA